MGHDGHLILARTISVLICSCDSHRKSNASDCELQQLGSQLSTLLAVYLWAILSLDLFPCPA